MKRFLILICILFSFRVNASALSFSPRVFESSLSEKNALSHFSLNASSSREEDEETAEDLFAWFVVICVAALGVCYYWFNTVRFLDYPYQDDETVSPADGNYVARGSISGLVLTLPSYSKNRFSFDTSLVYLHNLGIGNETRFEGLLFPYIGPYFENLALGKFYTNGTYDFEKSGFRDNIKLGGQISLLQTNILSAAFLIQYTTWRGNGFEDFKTGCNVGLLLRSYPVKPLVIEWKMGCHNYKHDFSVFESDLHFGFTHGPYEFFASWKYFNFYNSKNDNYFKDFSGASIGIRRYFCLPHS
ncbi:MAG: hypothetical protein IJ630_02940 [Treponema sp.]|nr:hypothetical protein [Treponema sp.]